MRGGTAGKNTKDRFPEREERTASPVSRVGSRPWAVVPLLRVTGSRETL